MDNERFFVVSGNDSSLSRRFLCAPVQEKSFLVRANNIAEAIDTASAQVELDFYVAVEATREDLLNTDIMILETDLQ